MVSLPRASTTPNHLNLDRTHTTSPFPDLYQPTLLTSQHPTRDKSPLLLLSNRVINVRLYTTLSTTLCKLRSLPTTRATKSNT